MADSGRRFSVGRHDAPSAKDGRKIPEHCPELTEEVTQADIPVLHQRVTGNTIPALEETFTLFEKNVPVLVEAAEPLVAGDTE